MGVDYEAEGGSEKQEEEGEEENMKSRERRRKLLLNRQDEPLEPRPSYSTCAGVCHAQPHWLRVQCKHCLPSLGSH